MRFATFHPCVVQRPPPVRRGFGQRMAGLTGTAGRLFVLPRLLSEQRKKEAERQTMRRQPIRSMWMI